MASTMKDISKYTGLGLATISSYFNGGNVREKNRKKIEEAIEVLHYEVNEVARGLKTNETKTIGVVIPELNNTFCAEIITGMEDILRSHGYATIVCDCRTDASLDVSLVMEGLPRDPSALSDGMRDLLGFCRRMAILEAMYPGEKPFLILDDPFTGLDEEHLARALSLVREVSRSWQVLYFTCHGARLP